MISFTTHTIHNDTSGETFEVKALATPKFPQAEVILRNCLQPGADKINRMLNEGHTLRLTSSPGTPLIKEAATIVD